MRLVPTQKLFLGLKIDSKMRDALGHATPGDRHYFEEGSPYLRICPHGEEQWIGKVVDGGLAPPEVDDLARNILSILTRIAPGSRHSASAMRIFSVDDQPGIATAPPEPPPSRNY